MKLKWTMDKCQEIATKYNNRSDFKKNDKNAYDASVKNKWLGEICIHMNYKNKPSGYWTKEKCQEIALKYTSISEFQKNNNSAYDKCLNLSWLDELCSHMNRKHKQNNYWTKEKCQEIANKYNTRSDFRKNDSSAYRTAIANSWLNDICANMKYLNNYWNYNKCQEEALKYTNRSEFQKKCGSAYAFASKNKILNNICSHMIKIGNIEHRCVYVFEFEDNCAYVGLTYNIIKREIDHNRKGPVYNHIKQSNIKYNLIQLTDYIIKEKAQIEEVKMITEYEQNGWVLLNTKKESTLGGSIIYWTYDKCKVEALKYKYKTEFIRNSSGAYSSARNNNWLIDICSHMIYHNPKNRWTDSEIKFLIENYHKGIKYCSKMLNKSYYSVKSQYQIKKVK